MCRGKRWCSQPSCLIRSCLSDKGQERRPSRRVASLTRGDPRYLADEFVLTPVARSWRLKRLPSLHWPFFWGSGWSIKSSGLHKLRWGGHRVSWIIQDVWAAVWLRPWGRACACVCVCVCVADQGLITGLQPLCQQLCPPHMKESCSVD